VLLAPALAALLALAPAADPRAELTAAQAREKAQAAAARLLADQERTLLDGLDEVEQGVASAERAWREAEARQAAAEQARERAAAAEAEAAARLGRRLGALRPRLLARARMGQAGPLSALLSAPTLGELVRRRFLLDRILSRDAGLVGEARAALAERERARAARAEEAGRSEAAAAEARERRVQARTLREERRALLSALRGARAFHERAAAEAAGQARRLAAFVATLPPPRAGGGRPAGSGFAALKGRLARPADGAVAVGFGKVVDPRFNTVTVQNGLDIAAPAGAPVHAVAPGRVVHAGWFKGYGNLVIVDHGDGFHSLVAHLASMRTAQGEDVEAGTVLGTVGDSGSLKGPYLYFELRQGGRPVDPAPWLGQ
jgi:septal ring factor EnvC (AmiA/AmiB activator)